MSYGSSSEGRLIGPAVPFEYLTRAEEHPEDESVGANQTGTMPGRDESTIGSGSHNRGAGSNQTAFGENLKNKILTKLDSVVEQFHRGQLNKQKAVKAIFGVLEGNTTLSISEQEAAFDSYFQEIGSTDSGLSGSLPTKQATNQSKNKSIKRVEEFLDDSPDEQDSEQDSDEEYSRAQKRRRFKESDMPWYKSPTDPRSTRSPTCRKTCELLTKYNTDLSQSKFSVTLAKDTISGFPKSQWKQILRGQPLDLNHVLTAVHRTTINEEAETCNGNTKRSAPVPEAKRHVKTATDWLAAWRFATRATAFAFPHHIEELQAYGDYIDGEFTAKATFAHPKIILFDIDIRNLVRGGQNILLSDSHKFLRLYSAIVSSSGAENQSGTVSRRNQNPGRVSSGSQNTCNWYNSAAGCRFSDNNCRYKHLCKNCKKAHPATQCTQKGLGDSAGKST